MELYQHQKDIIEKDIKWCGLFLGTGSAKTLTSLKLAKGRTLVITPKILKEEEKFKNEAKEWNIDLDIESYSKEQFKKVAYDLDYFDTVIVDEAHFFSGVDAQLKQKNYKDILKTSDMFRSLKDYLVKHNPKRLYLLTATPTRNAMSIWAFSHLLNKGWNFYQFRDKYYHKVVSGYRQFWVQKTSDILKNDLGRAVRNLGFTGKLEDYFDIPQQTYKTIYVEKTKDQIKKIKEVYTEYPEPIVRIGKIHQVENGVLKGNEFEEDTYIKDNKIEVIIDLTNEFKKVVIFAKYTNQIEKIKRTLDFDKKIIVITGKVKNRDVLIKEAEKTKECVLIIQSQINAGYELPSFPVMIFASNSYSVVDKIQSEGRILRANRLKKNLYIEIVTKGGVDEGVLKSLKDKKDFSEKIYAETRS